MFATNVVVALVTLFVPLLVRAEVGPTVPAPGDIYNPGSLCPIAWTGDPNSTTAWKNMTIQLMTGSNLDMQIITGIYSFLVISVLKAYSLLSRRHGSRRYC